MDYEPTRFIALAAADNGALWFNTGTALVAAFLGAAAAEFFAFRARSRERRERLYAAALSLFRKLTDIYSDAVTYSKDVAEARAREAASVARYEAIPEAERRQQFLASVGLMMNEYASVPADVTFSDDELWMMATAGNNVLLNATHGIDRRANGLYAALKTFTVSKAELRGRIDADHSIEFGEDNVATHIADEDAFKKNVSRIVMLDDLVRQIESLAVDLRANAFDATKHLVLTPKRPLGPKFKAGIKDLTGKTIVLQTSDAPKLKRWFTPWRKPEPTVEGTVMADAREPA